MHNQILNLTPTPKFGPWSNALGPGTRAAGRRLQSDASRARLVQNSNWTRCAAADNSIC